MRLFIILLLTAFLFSCGDQEKVKMLEDKYNRLENEYLTLAEKSDLKDKFIEEYTRTVNEVYENLERIRQREGLLTKFSKDIEKRENVSLKNRMMHHIHSIDTYLRESKKKLKFLSHKISVSEMQTGSLEKMIDNLNRRLKEKESYIAGLKENINNLNTQVAQAEEEIEHKNELILLQTRRINTGYYIIGGEKDLKAKGIIEEKGGIFGIRKTKKLAAGFDKQDFVETDITSTDGIQINEKLKKVKIISPHNPESFHLLEDDEELTRLEIVDPEEFWKIKYLVILTKG